MVDVYIIAVVLEVLLVACVRITYIILLML